MKKNITQRVTGLLMRHPAVNQVVLTGSRMRGDATRWSDWDFLVETNDFEAVSIVLPSLTESLEPLTHLWDPLSRHSIYMMILKGPTKVDICFNHLQQQQPPWVINSDTITQVNSHFWDWILWIASKEASGKKDMSAKELEKMYHYLLVPLGCKVSPSSVEEAVRDYLAAFRCQKRLLNAEADQVLETEVIKGLRNRGFEVLRIIQ
jgi:predicted nucleotidyltransferase